MIFSWKSVINFYWGHLFIWTKFFRWFCLEKKLAKKGFSEVMKKLIESSWISTLINSCFWKNMRIWFVLNLMSNLLLRSQKIMEFLLKLRNSWRWIKLKMIKIRFLVLQIKAVKNFSLIAKLIVFIQILLK